MKNKKQAIIEVFNWIVSDKYCMDILDKDWLFSEPIDYEYKKYKLGDIESKDKILKVWIEAFNTLENNKPLTSLVRIENVEMCKEAIQRYNILIVS